METWTTEEVDELFHLIDRYEKLFEQFKLRAILYGEYSLDRKAIIEMPVPIWKIIRSIKAGRVLFSNIIIKRGVNPCSEKKISESKKRK